MRRNGDRNLRNRDKILSRGGVSSAAPSYAAEMRQVVAEAVHARQRERGQAEAVYAAARELRISARRVKAILCGQVGRVWADEWDHARRWHAAYLARQAEALALQADAIAARAAAVRESLE